MVENNKVLTREWLVEQGAVLLIDDIYVFDKLMWVWKPQYLFWYVTERDSLEYVSKIETITEYNELMKTIKTCEICRERVATQVINCHAVADRDIHVCQQCVGLLIINEYEINKK